MTSTRQAVERMAAQRIGDAPDQHGQARPEVVEWVIDRPLRRAPRRGRLPGWLVPTAVAVTVLVTAGVVADRARSALDRPTGPVGASSSTAPERLPVAAGWQRISSLGVEVDAPASWPVNTWSECSGSGKPPPAALVTRGGTGGRRACLSRTVPASRLTIEQSALTVFDNVAPTRDVVTADGTPAVVVPRQYRGRAETVLVVASRGVTVTVASPDATVVDRIIASVRVVDVDSAGCRTAYPAAPAWDRRAAGPKVAAGDPESIGVCVYQSASLGPVVGASTTLTGAAARTAAATLDAAPAGALPDVVGTCPPGAPSGNPVVLHLRYADGRSVEARVHFSGCADRWVATPTGISQVTVDQLEALAGPLGIGVGRITSLPTP